MALTKEQFSALRSKGISTEQIIRFESGAKPKSPIDKALETTKDVISGGFRRQMSAGPASFNTITGGPATEFSHGVKAESGVRAGLPEIVSESLSGATDPQNLTSIAMQMNRIFKTPGAYERLLGQRVSAKGRATVSRLLPSAKIYEDVEQGRPSKVQVEGFNIIKKGSPERITDRFRNEREKVIAQVDDLIEKNNKPVEPSKIRERAIQILSNEFSNSSDDEVRALKNAILEEEKFTPFDTKTANARKRYLYKKTENFQKAAERGQQTTTRPEIQKVEDAYAQAYKEAIEEVFPEAKELNSRFGGLNAGAKAASKLVESELEQTPPGEKVASQTLGRPSNKSVLAAFIRELPLIGSSPKRLSGLIEKLRNRYGNLISGSRRKQAPNLIGREFYKYPKNIESAPSFKYGYSKPSISIENINPDVQEILEDVLGYKKPSSFYTPKEFRESSKPPYGKDLPYKELTLKELAKRKKNG